MTSREGFARFGSSSPVDDTVSVQVLQGEHDLRRVEAGARLVELARPLDLEHEIAAVHVLHHEEEPILQTILAFHYELEAGLSFNHQNPRLRLAVKSRPRPRFNRLKQFTIGR